MNELCEKVNLEVGLHHQPALVNSIAQGGQLMFILLIFLLRIHMYGKYDKKPLGGGGNCFMNIVYEILFFSSK